jgi:hypothetical protein
MQKHGFNWMRVWATWAAFENDVSAVDREGNPRSEFMERLRQLVSACNQRQMIVDVTLSRGNGVTGPARLRKLDHHRQAVESVVRALAPFRNWYLDLSNERNIQDERFTSVVDLRTLRGAARRIRKDLLVTASHAGDVSQEEMRQYLLDAGVDFLAPHRPRAPASAGQTFMKSQEYGIWMKAIGREVPLHYQEPFRRSFGGFDPDASAFLTDLRGAVRGGAAGWCLHNGDSRGKPDGKPRRSFDLRDVPLFTSLDAVESGVVPKLADVVREASQVAGQ